MTDSIPTQPKRDPPSGGEKTEPDRTARRAPVILGADSTRERAAPTTQRAPSSSRASVPPSEPRGSRASFADVPTDVERPARLQMIVAGILLLVLVAVPLYLWRRPRAESIASDTKDGGLELAPPTESEKVVVSEGKTLSCHDPGPRRTAPERCDRIPEIEKALATAIQENASCVPKGEGGGTIAYVADITFKKKALSLETPKEGRTLKNEKLVSACRTAVKTKLEKISFDNVTKHEHQRYRIQVVATHPGPVKP